MKYIKLFEDFNISLNESSVKESTYTWVPYDTELGNPLNSTIPAEVASIDEALSILQENGELLNVGFYLGTPKMEGGFVTVMIPNPEEKVSAKTFLAQAWNDEYKALTEAVSVNSVADFKKLSDLKIKAPVIFDELAGIFGDKETWDDAALLGDVGFGNS